MTEEKQEAKLEAYWSHYWSYSLMVAEPAWLACAPSWGLTYHFVLSKPPSCSHFDPSHNRKTLDAVIWNTISVLHKCMSHFNIKIYIHLGGFLLQNEISQVRNSCTLLKTDKGNVLILFYPWLLFGCFAWRDFLYYYFYAEIFFFVSLHFVLEREI